MFRIFDKATRRARAYAEAFVRNRYPTYTTGRSVFRAQDGPTYIIAVFYSEHGIHETPGRYLLIRVADAGACDELPDPTKSPYAIRGLK